MARQVNLVRSKVRQRMLTRLAESSGRPLECHGNVSPREMAVEGAKNPGTEPGVQVGPFAQHDLTGVCPDHCMQGLWSVRRAPSTVPAASLVLSSLAHRMMP